MIRLIDDFKNDPQGYYDGRWYLAKPENYKKGHYRMKDKLEGIFAVLRNKAFVVCFYEDKAGNK